MTSHPLPFPRQAHGTWIEGDRGFDGRPTPSPRRVYGEGTSSFAAEVCSRHTCFAPEAIIRCCRRLARCSMSSDGGNSSGNWALAHTVSSCSSPLSFHRSAVNCCFGSSAADEISGETVAIKMVTRVFDKIQLAKRALREITLLRHFSNHENITGLIDLDAISPNFNEMYVLPITSIAHAVSLIHYLVISLWRCVRTFLILLK
jgi:serine/threonine protein kinase